MQTKDQETLLDVMLGQRATSNLESVSGKASQIIPRPVSVMLELQPTNKKKCMSQHTF